MKLKDIALSAAAIGERVVKAIAIGAVEVWSAIKYIVFKDPVVEQICATNWGDGVGITEEQAAAVTDIGTLFRGNTEITSFDELELFTGVKKIKAYAFELCSNLTSIGLPNSITEIEYFSVEGCTKLSRLNINDLEAYCHINFHGITSTPLKAAKNLYIKGEYVDELVIPNSITEIKSNTFIGLSARRVVIHGGVSVIGSSSFQDCPRFDEVIIEDGVSEIRANAFYFAEIQGITIPSSVTKIERQAFFASKLPDGVVMLPTTPPELGTDVFHPYGSTPCPIYVPDESVEAYKTATNWSTYASRIKPLSEYTE